MALPSRPEGVFLAGMPVRVTLSNPGGGWRRAGLNGRAHAAKGNLSLVVLGGKSWSLAVLACRPQRRPQQNPRHLHRPTRLSGAAPNRHRRHHPRLAAAGWLSRHVGHGAQVPGVTLVVGSCSPAPPAAGAPQTRRPLEGDRCASTPRSSHSRHATL